MGKASVTRVVKFILKGDGGTSYQVVVDNATASVGASGLLSVSLTCHAIKSTGSENPVTATDGSMAVTAGSASPSWSSVVSGRYTLTGYSVSWLSAGSPTHLMLSYVVSGVAVATASIPIVVPGRMGRNFYYAGVYGDLSASGATFTVTDYQAPYVSYSENGVVKYKIWVGDNLSGASFSGHPLSESNWADMESSFKYLITEALFTAFAKLGSAIFNEDFMLSQYGYKNGSVSTAYGDMVPVSGKPTVFFPNIWVNWALGLLGITEGALGIYSKGGVKLAEFGKNGDYGSLRFFDTDGETELIDYGVEGIGYILSNGTTGGISEGIKVRGVSAGANVNSFFQNAQQAHPNDGTYYQYKSASIRLKTGVVKKFNEDYEDFLYDSSSVGSGGVPTGSPHDFGSYPCYLIESTPYRTSGDEQYYYVYLVRKKTNTHGTGGYVADRQSVTIVASKVYSVDGSTLTVTYYQVVSDGSWSSVFEF